ncbi:MAG TPA: hypothetical protein VGI03_01825 [Verrucomicrobiae bacterium]
MKNTVRNLTTAAALLMGAFFSCQPSFGQSSTTGVTANNLYMGFQNAGGSGTEDYIINLGAAANIVGGTTVVTLSSDFLAADFNGVLRSSSSAYGGVVGGSNGGSPSDLYVTQLRSGGPGNPAAPGSSLPGQLYRTDDNNAFSDLTTLVVPTTAGTGILDTTKSWETWIEAQPNPQASPSFWEDSGVNPDTAISKTAVFYEDLYYTASSSTFVSAPWTYEGYFTINFSGSSPAVTFTPAGAIVSLSQRPTFISAGKAGTTVTLVSTNAVATHNYQLQYSTSLSPASWSNIGSAISAGGTLVTNTDTTATNSARFYQLQGN